MITSANQVIRIRGRQIRRAGRSTKGVRLQRLEEGDEVIAITNLGVQTKPSTTSRANRPSPANRRRLPPRAARTHEVEEGRAAA